MKINDKTAAATIDKTLVDALNRDKKTSASVIANAETKINEDDTVNVALGKDVAKVLFSSDDDAEARRQKVELIKQQISTLGVDGYLKQLSSKPDYYSKLASNISSEVSLFQHLAGSDE